MRALLVLLSSLAFALPGFAAEPAVLSLEKAGSIPRFVVAAPDFSVAASADDKTIDVFRLSDGRQIGRFDSPRAKPALRGDEELQGFSPVDVSADGKKLLLAREQRTATKGGHWSENERTLLLVDLTDGSSKELFKRRGGCMYLDGDSPIHISTCFNVRGGFLADGKSVGVADGHYASGSFYASSGRGVVEYEAAVVGPDGKVASDVKARSERRVYSDRSPAPPEVSGAPGAAEAGFDGRGRLLGAAQDSGGCEVRDLAAGKHVSFLDGCNEQYSLSFARGGLVVSRPNGSIGLGARSLKVWDATTGDLLYGTDKTDAEVARADGGGPAFVLADHHLAIMDGGFKQVVAVAELPEASRLSAVSPDGGRILVDEGGGYAIYRTGLSRETGSQPAPPPEPAAAVVDLDAPPAARTKTDPDAYAVIIGVEKYRQEGIPAVDFAAHDAETMYAYLTKAMGYDPKNVVLLTDEKAVKTDFAKYLGTWLKNRADAKSRVFIYYAGHGSPNPASGEGYLMPYEADPAYLEDTAFPIARLYSDLAKLPAKDVTVVLDACFSGQGGRSLIAKGARPLVQAKQPAGPSNAVVLTAAGGAQISASDPARRHGLLTAYLLEGLHGAADKTGDGRITGGELFAYVKPAVERAARLQNVEQTPTLSGAPGSAPWVVLEKPSR